MGIVLYHGSVDWITDFKLMKPRRALDLGSEFKAADTEWLLYNAYNRLNKPLGRNAGFDIVVGAIADGKRQAAFNKLYDMLEWA